MISGHAPPLKAMECVLPQRTTAPPHGMACSRSGSPAAVRCAAALERPAGRCARPGPYGLVFRAGRRRRGRSAINPRSAVLTASASGK
jgi:hypothetical protein